MSLGGSNENWERNYAPQTLEIKVNWMCEGDPSANYWRNKACDAEFISFQINTQQEKKLTFMSTENMWMWVLKKRERCLTKCGDTEKILGGVFVVVTCTILNTQDFSLVLDYKSVGYPE